MSVLFLLQGKCFGHELSPPQDTLPRDAQASEAACDALSGGHLVKIETARQNHLIEDHLIFTFGYESFSKNI